MQKVLGQRRTFNYVKIESSETSVDREPTAEEIDQYYKDLAEEFVVPEKRDVTVFLLTTKMIADKMEVSEDDIKTYREQFIDEFEQPEKREVLQMVFSSKELADEYKSKLNGGADFLDLAKQNGQSEQDTNFGFVSASELSDELSPVAFALKKGGIYRRARRECTAY
jgi:peptidyl-prolyl cis-trans isomerase D